MHEFLVTVEGKGGISSSRLQLARLRFDVSLLLTSLCTCATPALNGQAEPAVGESAARACVVAAREQPKLPSKGLQQSSGKDSVLRSSAKRLAPGTVLLGVPLPGGNAKGTRYRGTGFVISKSNRLVATAAHVADSFSVGEGMWAIIGGSQQAYRVTRAWYHPGTKRSLDYGLYVRSYDPRDGEIASTSPDVAVLELSGGGPDPPMQLELANDAELRTLQRRRVGILGYPEAKLDRIWPRRGQPAIPSLATCTIGLTTALAPRLGATASIGQKQWLRFDDNLGAGASGGPIFLASGRVVGLVSRGSETISPDGFYPDSGCRIDLVRELVEYHRLAKQKPGVQSKIQARVDWGPDPRISDFRKAVDLLDKADRLVTKRAYREAEQQCNAALLIAPNYGRALLARSGVYLCTLEKVWDRLTPDKRAVYARLAYEDAVRCFNAYPEYIHAWLLMGQCLVYLAKTNVLAGAPAYVLEEMGPELERVGPDQRLTNFERSFLLNVCAQAHQLRGETREAENKFQESIRLNPTEPQYYWNRARFWEERGCRHLADLDRSKARWLELLRDVGWFAPL